MSKVHKTKMYECMAFFPEGHPKKWKYVTNLKSFVDFLAREHSTWKYVNVYEKGTKRFLKRFYPGNLLPKTLSLFLIFHTLNTSYENTSNRATSNTSINGFNNTATIPSFSNQPKEGLWKS